MHFLFRATTAPERRCGKPMSATRRQNEVAFNSVSGIRPENVKWEIQAREQLFDVDPQEPWYIAPEISYSRQQILFNDSPGPHPGGLYLTLRGLAPN